MRRNLDVPLIFSLWNTDLTNRDLAQRIGVSVSSLWDIRKKYGLPPRKHERKECPTDDPTPDEIAERCAEVQSRWSLADRKARACKGVVASWSPPAYTGYDRRNASFSY